MQADLSSNRLAEKDQNFREFTIWPVIEEFNTQKWLNNFLPDEKQVAERLLNNFYYFNERMTDALLRAAIQNYFCQVGKNNHENGAWIENCIRETAFVLCEGENPHPTDSGNLFARKIRDKIFIPESNIMNPKDALERRKEFGGFILIDDFSGSGNQFESTWTRQYEISERLISFQDISKCVHQRFAYCCCFSTWKAEQKIRTVAPTVILSPAHKILNHHSAVCSNSRIWQDMDFQSARHIIHKASQRAGYRTEDCGQEDWRGFHALGLTLAFNHGIPDASLPLFFSNRNGWKPLINRIQS